MKAFAFLILPTLLALAPLQTAPGSFKATAPQRVHNDNDDTGLLPWHQQMPLGEAHGWVDDTTTLTVWVYAGVVFGPMYAHNVPAPSYGDAMVDGHLCAWVQVPIPGGGMMTIEQPIPAGTGGDLTLAVEEYKESVEQAGETVHSCHDNAGGT